MDPTHVTLSHRPTGADGAVGAPAAAEGYDVLRRIGVEGEVELLEVRDLALDRVVEGRRVARADSATGRALLADATVRARLEHAYVPPTFAVLHGEDGSVTVLSRRSTAVPWSPGRDRAADLEILAKACEAVAFAHAEGLVHGDLAPDRVRAGPHGEVLVTGWAHARRFEGDGDARREAERADTLALRRMFDDVIAGFDVSPPETTGAAAIARAAIAARREVENAAAAATHLASARAAMESCRVGLQGAPPPAREERRWWMLTRMPGRLRPDLPDRALALLGRAPELTSEIELALASLARADRALRAALELRPQDAEARALAADVAFSFVHVALREKHAALAVDMCTRMEDLDPAGGAALRALVQTAIFHDPHTLQSYARWRTWALLTLPMLTPLVLAVVLSAGGVALRRGTRRALAAARAATAAATVFQGLLLGASIAWPFVLDVRGVNDVAGFFAFTGALFTLPPFVIATLASSALFGRELRRLPWSDA